MCCISSVISPLLQPPHMSLFISNIMLLSENLSPPLQTHPKSREPRRRHSRPPPPKKKPCAFELSSHLPVGLRGCENAVDRKRHTKREWEERVGGYITTVLTKETSSGLQKRSGDNKCRCSRLLKLSTAQEKGEIMQGGLLLAKQDCVPF